MFTAIKDYFVGSFHEMKKVTWPTKNQTINYSLVVIGLSIGMAMFLGLLDYVFEMGVTALFLR